MSASAPTVWETFAGHARRHPGRVAIRAGGSDGIDGIDGIDGFDGEAVTYGELLRRAGDLASRIGTSLPSGSVLALDADEPALGALAFLAAARSRCAVLPLNRESPARHRAAMLADARPAAMLAPDRSGWLDLAAVPDPDGAQAPAPAPATGFDQVSYVLFTSGSTGRPKGVMVSHRALVDRLAGLAAVPGLRPGQSMLAMTALSFDISIAEMLLPLTVGGTVVAAPAGTRLDPGILADVVARRAPDVLQATPSFWRLAVAAGWAGAPNSDIWCGGEQLTDALAGHLLGRCRHLWNVYGPTEATIWASARLVTSPDAVSLGAALPGSGIGLAGPDGATSGPGAEGEILLHGKGLALGYLNQPELTAERFRIADTGAGRRRCYHTGDRGRYRPDGTIEFLGRQDGQVKLRGHRIELGEIERTLEAHEAVSEAVAVLRAGDDPARAHLAVVVVVRPGVTAATLRGWLAERLPPALRPARIDLVDVMPRTVAGKVDRRALVGPR